LATIGSRRWCFAFARGGLVDFDLATGKVDFHYAWRARLLESVNASVPVATGDEVFISEAYGPGSSLLRVRPGGYDVVWRDELRSRAKAMQTHWNTPIYHEAVPRPAVRARRRPPDLTFQPRNGISPRRKQFVPPDRLIP